MTFRLGLTGSIGMGKSTTARFFAEEGCAIWDADEAVHRLYARDGAAVAPIAEVYPQAVHGGAVCRSRLRDIMAQDPGALARIEKIVHPLVARDREQFLRSTSADIAVFDIPLLFETGGDMLMDAVACVTVSHETQKERVLARGTMNEADFDAIRQKQMSDAEKQARADYVIETDTMEHAREQVQAIVADIRKRLENA